MEHKEPTRKDLIAIIIERILLDISKETCSLVERRLFANYYCKFSDCYRHPEYLNVILQEIFGANYFVITDKIKAALEKYTPDKKLAKFIEIPVR